MDKRANKMDNETLQQFLAFRKRASRVPIRRKKQWKNLGLQKLNRVCS